MWHFLSFPSPRWGPGQALSEAASHSKADEAERGSRWWGGVGGVRPVWGRRHSEKGLAGTAWGGNLRWIFVLTSS